MKSLDVQIGGNHYKGCGYQPVKFAVDLNLNFIQGNIVKYATRYRSKNGKQDLQKVIHYAQLGRDLKPQNNVIFDNRPSKNIDIYVSMNGLNETERKIISGAVWQCWSIIEHYGNKLIEEYE